MTFTGGSVSPDSYLRYIVVKYSDIQRLMIETMNFFREECVRFLSYVTVVDKLKLYKKGLIRGNFLVPGNLRRKYRRVAIFCVKLTQKWVFSSKNQFKKSVNLRKKQQNTPKTYQKLSHPKIFTQKTRQLIKNLRKFPATSRPPSPRHTLHPTKKNPTSATTNAP